MTRLDDDIAAGNPRVWQQGLSGSYAIALKQLHPGLRFGIAGYQELEGWLPEHYFAHDDNYAYDSLGRHPLPYRGRAGDRDVQQLDEDPADWGIPEEEDRGKYVPLAVEHARQLHDTLAASDSQTA